MFGTLELNRTNPAHIGSQPLMDSKNKVLNADGNFSVLENGSAKKNSFESYLMDAVNEMNGQQLEVSVMQEKLITDPDSVDIHDVTTAMAKAQMSLSLAQTVIDRLVQSWNELSVTR